MAASIVSAGPAGAAGGLGGALDWTGCNKCVHRCSGEGPLASDQVAGAMREGMVVWLQWWVGVCRLRGGGGGARPPRFHHCVCRPISERDVVGGCARARGRCLLVKIPLQSPVSTRCPDVHWSLPARSSASVSSPAFRSFRSFSLQGYPTSTRLVKSIGLVKSNGQKSQEFRQNWKGHHVDLAVGASTAQDFSLTRVFSRC